MKKITKLTPTSSWKGGRMPNGKETYSEKTYFNAWDKVNKTLERKLGVKVFGFDPSISVYDADDGMMNRTCQLPMWLVRKILAIKPL
jgi:hypothetical protein